MPKSSTVAFYSLVSLLTWEKRCYPGTCDVGLTSRGSHFVGHRAWPQSPSYNISFPDG